MSEASEKRSDRLYYGVLLLFAAAYLVTRIPSMELDPRLFATGAALGALVTGLAVLLSQPLAPRLYLIFTLILLAWPLLRLGLAGYSRERALMMAGGLIALPGYWVIKWAVAPGETEAEEP